MYLDISGNNNSIYQTISLLEYLRTAQGIPGPFLVIAPLSTIENWQREITDWTTMRVC